MEANMSIEVEKIEIRANENWSECSDVLTMDS